MKMSAVSSITVLLLCCSTLASTDPQGGCDYYIATNDSFSVPLQPPQTVLDMLRWKHNDDPIFKRSHGKVIMGNEEDVHQNGSLKLKNVGKSEAGTYTPEVYDTNGQAVGNLKSIRLCILDRVLKPKVTFDCSSSVKFVCSVDQEAKDLTFEWLQNNEVLEGVKDRTLTKPVKELGTDTLSCKVSNHVSSMTSDAVKHTCKGPGVSFPKTVFGINIWILVGGGGGIVLLLIVMVIICCIQNRRKKSLQLKDEEELRLEWTNPNQQQQQQQQQQHRHHNHNHPPDQHHHHHHHQQQPAGHTGPRQHRSKQQRSQQRPRAPDHPNGHPQPSPRRPAQGPRPAEKGNDEQPPPLPQPRKKAPKTQRV